MAGVLLVSVSKSPGVYNLGSPFSSTLAVNDHWNQGRDCASEEAIYRASFAPCFTTTTPAPKSASRVCPFQLLLNSPGFLIVAIVERNPSQRGP